MKPISRILILAMLHLCWLTSYGWAEMLPTESAVQPQVQDDRQRILDLLDRQEVIIELEKYGITKVEAIVRINSLTDDEVVALAGEMDRLHAGGDQALALVLAAAIMVVLYVPGLVFKTIYCIFASTACEKKGGAEWVFRFWLEDIDWGPGPSSPKKQCDLICSYHLNNCLQSDTVRNAAREECFEVNKVCLQQCDTEHGNTDPIPIEEDCDPGIESCP